MTSGAGDTTGLRYLSYSKSKIPVVGALIDYLDTSVEYLKRRTFVQAERLQARASKAALSASFLASVTLLLGLVSNVKFEVVMFDEQPLPNDLPVMIMSKVENLYIDDIDGSRIQWCLEVSDFVVILISCLLIWNSSNVSSPLCEYFFLPWLGATLRGLFLRQGPTAAALIYTMAVVNGKVNPLFMTSFSFLFLLEARLWLEVARLVRARWERRNDIQGPQAMYELETLWSNDDVQSVEVNNMTSGGGGDTAGLRCLSYFKSKIPVVGALKNHLYTGVTADLKYLKCRTLVLAGRLQRWARRATYSPTYFAAVTFLLGLLTNVKFTTWMLYKEPRHITYVILLHLDLSDYVEILINCLLIWSTDTYSTGFPSNPYFWMPCLGAAVRGSHRQVSTATAICNTMVVLKGKVDPVFQQYFSFLRRFKLLIGLEFIRLCFARLEEDDMYE